MRKKKRGRRRKIGEIEEVHTENVGGKESETEGDDWRKLKWEKHEIKKKMKIKINWSSVMNESNLKNRISRFITNFETI